MEYFDEKIINKRLRIVRNSDGALFVAKKAEASALDIYTALKGLDNKHIIKIYDILQTDGGYEIIEEYVDGVTLYELAKHRRFTCEEIGLYTTAVCDGLSALHKAGIIHRDITYNNVMLSRYGEIKIIDFDISRVHVKQKAADTEILGTPGFAAPEQFGFAQSNEKTDVYALGCLMRFMLNNADGSKEKAGLEHIAKICTKFTPEQRYKNTDALKKAILALNGRQKWTYKFFKTLRFAYYLMLLIFMVLPLAITHFSIETLIFIAEFFTVLMLPLMMFANEFDWQDHFPDLKYAKKGVKIFIMVTLYLFVLICVVLIEAIWSAK